MSAALLRPIVPALLISGALVFASQSLLFGFAEKYANKAAQQAQNMQQTVMLAADEVVTSNTPPLNMLLQDAASLRKNFSDDNPLAIHEHVMQLASDTHVQIQSIEPARASTRLPKDETTLHVQAFEVHFVADYGNLVDFILTLERRSPWIKILDWSIEPFAQNGRPTVRGGVRFEQFSLDTTQLITLALSLQEDG